MPRKEQGWITFQVSEEEREILEEFCRQSQRTKTEVLRELVRGLERHPPALKAAPADPSLHLPQQTSNHPQMMKISARNVFPSRITGIVLDGVNAEVTVEVSPDVYLVSIITRASAERMGLVEGKEILAIVKSNSVMLAEI